VSVTGPDGVEWVTAAEVRERMPGLSYRTLQSWRRRKRVRSLRSAGQVWVAWPDVLEREAAAHRTDWRRGRRATCSQ
jgi:hypothetical protein